MQEAAETTTRLESNDIDMKLPTDSVSCMSTEGAGRADSSRCQTWLGADGPGIGRRSVLFHGFPESGGESTKNHGPRFEVPPGAGGLLKNCSGLPGFEQGDIQSPWALKTAGHLGIQSSLRPVGRPKLVKVAGKNCFLILSQRPRTLRQRRRQGARRGRSAGRQSPRLVPRVPDQVTFCFGRGVDRMRGRRPEIGSGQRNNCR